MPFKLFNRDQDKSKPAKGGMPKRLATCDLCSKELLAMINENGYFSTMVVVGDPSQQEIAFIGSCENCDLDICANCAAWVIDQKMSVGKRAACKRCGNLLRSKTEIDIQRIKIALQAPPNKPDELRRIIRIMQEEMPVLIDMTGEDNFKEIRKALMDYLAAVDR